MARLSKNDLEKVRAAFKVADAVGAFHQYFSDYMENVRWGKMATVDGAILLEHHMKLVNAAINYSMIKSRSYDEIIERLVCDE